MRYYILIFFLLFSSFSFANVAPHHQLTNISKKEIRKKKRQIRKQEKKKGIKLVLCFFLGALGVHRFYMGGKKNTTIGILQIVTLGGFGLWVLGDFVRIIIGDL